MFTSGKLQQVVETCITRATKYNDINIQYKPEACSKNPSVVIRASMEGNHKNKKEFEKKRYFFCVFK
jgi:hypothetical protein